MLKRQEGSWYSKEVELELIEGFKSFTFTNENNLVHMHYNLLSDTYKQVLKDGLRESFPSLTSEEINDYLINCSY